MKIQAITKFGERFFYSHHLALCVDDVRLGTDKSFADLTLPVTMKVKTNLKILRQTDDGQHALAFIITQVIGCAEDVQNVCKPSD